MSVTQAPGSVQPSGVSATPVPVSEQPPTESLEIASPVNEALLCSGFTIRGSATGLASGQLAMILLQSADGGRIYPQGPLIPNEEGVWQINVVGLPLGQRFSLTPVLPHGESLNQLNEYLETGRSTGVWAGRGRHPCGREVLSIPSTYKSIRTRVQDLKTRHREMTPNTTDTK